MKKIKGFFLVIIGIFLTLNCNVNGIEMKGNSNLLWHKENDSWLPRTYIQVNNTSGHFFIIDKIENIINGVDGNNNTYRDINSTFTNMKYLMPFWNYSIYYDDRAIGYPTPLINYTYDTYFYFLGFEEKYLISNNTIIIDLNDKAVIKEKEINIKILDSKDAIVTYYKSYSNPYSYPVNIKVYDNHYEDRFVLDDEYDITIYPEYDYEIYTFEDGYLLWVQPYDVTIEPSSDFNTYVKYKINNVSNKYDDYYEISDIAYIQEAKVEKTKIIIRGFRLTLLSPS